MKVLSSGRVRGRLIGGRVHGPRGLELLVGAAVRKLDDGRTIGRLSADASVHGSQSSVVGSPTVEIDPDLDAPRLAMHLATGTPLGDDLPPIDLRIATTRGTNALLVGATGRVLLITNRGLEDLAVIGDQSRPDLFDLNVRPPRLEPAAVLGIDARLDADGHELVPLDVAEVVASVAARIDMGDKDDKDDMDGAAFDAIAICLLHSWRNPSHETRLAEAIAARFPLLRRSVGSVCSPDIRLVPRVRTVVADAALAPVMQAFLDGLGLDHHESQVLAMTSGGGLVDSATYRPSESLLSGPAAGIVGAIATAAKSNVHRIVGFDMGGTSTDVGRAERVADLRDVTQVGSATVRTPCVDLHTIAAGGGSICRVREGRLQVGPDSAGAAPGPACFGAGGPLTITDVNLLLGRADPARFGVPLMIEHAEAAIETISSDTGRSRKDLLEGFVSLADERMAEAIRTVTTRRGEDPMDHVLVAFGGAGGQHACGVASRLGMQRVIVPRDGGLLSAVGLHVAVRERAVEETVLRPIVEFDPGPPLAEVERRALEVARKAGVDHPVIRRRQMRCRLVGQNSTIDLDLDQSAVLVESDGLGRMFREAYRRLYGHAPPDRPIELASIRVFAGDASGDEPPAPEPSTANSRRSRKGARSIDRADLLPAQVVRGPALIADDTSTIHVAIGWIATVDDSGSILLDRGDSGAVGIEGAAASEIMACRLESIALDMGETLRRTALSVNVKERLDYSCGIVDSDGRLVVNAPHMPVHLGALGDCVRAVTARLDLHQGDVAMVNHPGFGGSHLPDITVVTPVFDTHGKCFAYAVNRAHHAEIGGSRPGSMPPDARHLSEEGVVIAPMKIVERGVPRFDLFKDLLTDAPFPSRAVADNLADLAGQLAANRLGAERLEALHTLVGPARFAGDLVSLRDRCGSSIRRLSTRLDGMNRDVTERLDDGTPIRVRVRSESGRMHIDFTGSGGQHPGNLNAPLAVVRAAVLYVLRVVAGEDIPLNEGAIDAVELVCPVGFLNPRFSGDPTVDPAVAIGNTETSQRVVDTLLKAFEIVACSQGTMNNLLLGNDRFGYYETICGGTGAGDEFSGCDAVHSHMTNTRLTDPEVLEHRYPLRLVRFEIRRGSGGSGIKCGGDGVRRVIAALSPLSGSLLAQHHLERPYGLDSGEAGRCGEARIIRHCGTTHELPGISAFELEPGDQLWIETPGGGGCGAV
ncbi:MAG: hydantoinase B/oxoprolinase family protein [Phycisphaerales bacterium]|nr:hydantoinase B/oxoprolinase family protein [Phycisphaerales bacterium]